MRYVTTSTIDFPKRFLNARNSRFNSRLFQISLGACASGREERGTKCLLPHGTLARCAAAGGTYSCKIAAMVRVFFPLAVVRLHPMKRAKLTGR